MMLFNLLLSILVLTSCSILFKYCLLVSSQTHSVLEESVYLFLVLIFILLFDLYLLTFILFIWRVLPSTFNIWNRNCINVWFLFFFCDVTHHPVIGYFGAITVLTTVKIICTHSQPEHFKWNINAINCPF